MMPQTPALLKADRTEHAASALLLAHLPPAHAACVLPTCLPATVHRVNVIAFITFSPTAAKQFSMFTPVASDCQSIFHPVA